MNEEDVFSFIDVWQVDVYLSVESSGAQQCFVQYVGSVGGCHDYDAAVGAEAVHFGEELVECAFAFVVGAHLYAFASCSSDGVYFVDEDDAGCFFFGLAEEVAHSACADTDEHFDEVATRHAEEWHIGFSCYGFGEQCFACSGRAYEECAFGYFASEVGVSLGIFEEFYDFLYFEFCAFLSGNVGKGDFVFVVFLEEFGSALAYVEDAHGASAFAIASVHAPHEEYPEEDDEDEGAEAPEESHDAVVVVARLPFCFAGVVLELFLLADEVVEFVGRGELHDDEVSCGAVYFLVFEDVAYVARLDVHL